MILRAYMKMLHPHGETGLRVKPSWWDSGGIRQRPVCMEVLSGGRRDREFWEYFWALRGFLVENCKGIMDKVSTSCLNVNGTSAVIQE